MRPAGIHKSHDLMTYISLSANFSLWSISMIKIVCVFGFNIAFNNFSVIS